MSIKVRYRQESGNCGLLVLEATPHMRTILTWDKTYCQMYLPFPYIIYIINYCINGNGYVYKGVYGKGLCVFLSNESLSSFDSMLCNSPTDTERNGLVCTHHSYDNKVFTSLPELVNKVLGLWAGAIQVIRPPVFVKAWEKLTLETVTKVAWKNAFTLRAAIDWDGTYLTDRNSIIKTVPLGATLINEDLVTNGN